MTERRIWRPHPQWWFTLFMLAIFVWAIIEGWGWSERTRLFPIVVAIPSLALVIYQLGRDMTRRVSVDATSGEVLAQVGKSSGSMESAQTEGLAKASGWQILKVASHMLAYFVGLYLIGFLEVIPIYTALYLRLVAREPWWRALVQAALVWGFTWALFDQVLHLPFSSGVITVFVRQYFGS